MFGKSSRIPGSITSCDMVSSLASADREDAQGISFRKSLALREKARVAYHQADNDMALRRACLRRSRPDRNAYHPGEWVMLWQPEQNGGHWFGPLKVVNQEDRNSVWATHGGKLYRRALEHVRPVCSTEVSQIPITDQHSIPSQPIQGTPPEIIPSDNPNTMDNSNSPIKFPLIVPIHSPIKITTVNLKINQTLNPKPVKHHRNH